MSKINGVHGSGLPAGTIVPCGNSAALPRTLMCDGSAVSRTTYPALFAAIGESFGSGDGSTTFNVPDFRGRFLRGVDGTASRDPDKAYRTAMNSGGNSGNGVGSVQTHQFNAHGHTYGPMGSGSSQPVVFGNASPAGGGSSPVSYNQPFNGGAGSGHWMTINDNGGSETRPTNAYVNYCVAY